MTNRSDPWASIRNLGPVSIEQLRLIGITTPEQLFEVGPVEAYVRLKHAYPHRINRTMLWALAGAELDIDWREVPAETKQQLQAELTQHHAEYS
jgi:DNA transformation protein